MLLMLAITAGRETRLIPMEKNLLAYTLDYMG